jgi:lysophospholipase L1-like esterase
MTARGRLRSALVTMVMALAGFVMPGALPAAANSRIFQYVALGDSYAAGQGAGSYLNNCLQSPNGYPGLLDSKSRIDLHANVTCTGATTIVVANTQLSALDRDTRLVTLTVGGNDLGVSTVATTCTTRPQAECEAAINNAIALLVVPPGGEGVLGGRLTDLYADVADAAPNARIVVTGYPLLFEPLPTTDPKAAIIRAINEATIALNETIEQAVAVTRDADVNIRYVDVTAAFAGHGIYSTDAFINPPDPLKPTDPNAFHPNADGYVAYADAIAARLPGGWLDKQKQLI